MPITVVQLNGVDKQIWQVNDEKTPLLIMLLNEIGEREYQGPIKDPGNNEEIKKAT